MFTLNQAFQTIMQYVMCYLPASSDTSQNIGGSEAI